MVAEEKKSYKDEMADLERRRIRGVQKILDGVKPIEVARDVLYEQTETYFSKTRVLSALHKLGFSFQKPQVRALEKKTTKSSNG